ncbi:hypothetical protein J4Q44_G00030800 [Coregonus suidteri]|uniref:Uncharacterized protein n=1 Tax=Coregonus suidteri TaxID=861788 RepID=A0AAN8M9T6_9TELE
MNEEMGGKNINLIFMEDIVCKMHVTIVDEREGPRRSMKFNTRYVEGAVGLWSYLRHFGKVTKGMTPSHRIDLLTDALLHHGKKMPQRKLDSLPQRLS